MGERLLCKQEVIGSIPFTSTTARTTQSVVRRELRQRLREQPRERQRGARAAASEEQLIDRE